MTASFDLYQRILDNRPLKLSPEETSYRHAAGKERCSACIHFFTRDIDGFTVCEIMRPLGKGSEAVIPHYVCRFFTEDAENHPLLHD